jgi:chorismate mutase
MRTLKYSHLGEKVIVRVAQKTTNILPQLQDLMQQLEENGKDSREVISSVLISVLSDIEDRLSD